MNAKTRSRIMRSIHSKHTIPEMQVRRFLFASGLRYRLHDKSLPGTPDIVLKRHKLVVFVNGCFWHSHNCPAGSRPRTNTDYWLPKLANNQAKDKKAVRACCMNRFLALLVHNGIDPVSVCWWALHGKGWFLAFMQQARQPFKEPKWVASNRCLGVPNQITTIFIEAVCLCHSVKIRP